MKLTFVGHACFLAESSSGLRVLLDPYQPGAFGGRLGFRPFDERVDVVASTHDHIDHFHLDPAFGEPAVVTQTGTAHGIDFLGFRLPHDAEGGRVRGMVTGLRFALDGVTVFHPGDLGRPLTDDEAAAVRPVDVLLLPTGGTFTVDAAGALAVMRALAPAVAIPMHHAHPRVQLPLAPVADFLALVPRHERVGAGPLVLDPHLLPPPTTVLVMEPTR